MIYEFTEDPAKQLEIANDPNLCFKGSMVAFTEPVIIKNTTIKEMDIYASYFIGGLTLMGCIVESAVKWASGGHNQKPIIFDQCDFHDFVDFEDCTFEAPVQLKNVRFRKGTNLLGNQGTPVEVSFTFPADIHQCQGDLRVSTFDREPSLT